MRDPITLGLLLSAALHLAVLVLIQPTPGGGAPRTLVLNARLEGPPASPAEAPPAAEETPPQETPPPSLPEPPLPQTPPPQPVPVMTSPVPAPVSLPLPPASPEPVRPAPTPAATTASTAPPSGAPAAIPSPRVGPAAGSSLPSLPLGIDPTWYAARQVDSQPKAIGIIQPEYPEEARRVNLEGSVKLMLKIDELGRVKEAEVVESIPPGAFDGAALKAFRDAVFRPAMKDGRPVRYQAYMRVDFKLED